MRCAPASFDVLLDIVGGSGYRDALFYSKEASNPLNQPELVPFTSGSENRAPRCPTAASRSHQWVLGSDLRHPRSARTPPCPELVVQQRF